MTRSTDAKLTAHVLRLLQDDGWDVKETDLGRRVMFTARKGGQVQIVGGAQEDRYKCACELAVKCGADLE